MKRFISLFLLLAVVLVWLCPAVLATEQKIVDEADILTEYEENGLQQHAQQLADTYQIDVVILTVWGLGGKTVEAYADDYFDYNGYGIGYDHSGVLLMLSMEDRQWAISTCGDAIYALTDYGQQAIFSQIAGYLAEDEYYDAFDTYLDELEVYFEAFAGGNPIDGWGGYYDGPGTFIPGTRDDVVYYQEGLTPTKIIVRLLTALVIGAAVAGIVVLIMGHGMNTARAQRGALSYLKNGSYELSAQRDMYLYSRVNKIRRQSDSSSSRGGGSSSHRSSSGRSHGGSHGRF